MRIALGISYQGTHYHGWQAQPQLVTIQSTLEAAIARIANHPVELSCAGRTDKGVHALGQVGHFDTVSHREKRGWLLGINTYLPQDIRVDWVEEVEEAFHARFSALFRRYRYIIRNHPAPSALWNQYTTHYYRPLDEQRMQEATMYLIGEHDFSAFRASSCQSKTPIRKITELRVSRQAHRVTIDITANAFLHHMVRNIAAVLMLIGSGKQPPKWAEEVLRTCDRSQAGITAAPNGLYLCEVGYPNPFRLPSSQAEEWMD